ncbi:MAG TPA: hypothetical protein VLF67_05055, partial [Candidatus Saccharimonas sp.]|nr:hypothetical protein [Candidatus Saccharimonas sp.]
MLPIEFIATDLHFAVSLLAALACAAISWLYLDAWLSEGHPPKELWKWTGFAIIALGFAASATEVEPSFLPHSLLAYAGLAGTILRCLGYAGLVVGLTLDRLEPIPAVPGLQLGDAPESDAPAAPKAPALAAWGAGALHFTAAALAGAASYYYWHRATVGLERHLKPVAWATAWIALFELLDAASLFTSPFGLVWVSKLLVLAIGTLVLSAWVWRYLTKRLQTQLFMVLSAASFAIFTATIISFTFLLMSRVQATAFDSLGTTAKVLDYAVAGQLSSVTADAAGAAQDPAVVAATASADSSRLGTYLKDYLRTQGRSSLIITDDAGKILWRAENPADHTSLADNTLFDRAAVGQTAAGLAALTAPSSQ